MLAALTDDTHVADQRVRYGIRREHLRSALEDAGYRIEHSDAGLYLWATRERDEDAGSGAQCWTMVAEMADRGILVAPGSFYGVAGAGHVRLALTATDERVDAAVQRLAYRGQGG
jgi:aspartate/methionine/tyrosine aminotransferase